MHQDIMVEAVNDATFDLPPIDIGITAFGTVHLQEQLYVSKK